MEVQNRGQEVKSNQHEQFEEGGRNILDRQDKAHPPKADEGAFAAQDDLFATDAEFAAETANPVIVRPDVGQRTELPREDALRKRDEAEDQVREGSMLGWVALVLSVASLFFWQSVLGPAAIVVGIFAWIRGNRALGTWSVVLGFIALLAYFVLVPNYA